MEGNIPQQKQQNNLPTTSKEYLTNNPTRYAPIKSPRNLHNFPDNYLKLLPKFNGEDEITTLEHLSSFDYFIDNQGLEHEDMYMIIFVQTFEGEVRTWFKGLPPNSIDSWDALESSFLRQWGEKRIIYII
jgi:hypothetical protein